MRITSVRWFLVAGVLASLASAHAERLRSPWDATTITPPITPTDAPYNCPAPPAFTKTIDAEGYYSDANHSIIDPAKKAAYEKADADLVHLGQYAGLAADAWLSKGSRAAAACVYTLLSAAAQAAAWTGQMPHNQGVYDQNWLLSGTAIPYLKVRNSQVGTPDQDAEIQKWFKQLAARVRDYFDMKRSHPGSDAWNNHIYWAGLAVAAQAIACDDRKAFKWGLETYRTGVDAINPDGSLNAEMSRASMALHYQLYALGPLIMVAERPTASTCTVQTTAPSIAWSSSTPPRCLIRPLSLAAQASNRTSLTMSRDSRSAGPFPMFGAIPTRNFQH